MHVARLLAVSSSPAWCVAAFALALALVSVGCSDDDSGKPAGAMARIAVLSAFPAELVPLVEQASIDETVILEGRKYRLGKLAGVPVVLALTGVGLGNAAATTRTVIEELNVSGVIVSAVAGSTQRIGDVTVPLMWRFKTAPTTTYSVDLHWLDLAEQLAASVRLDLCTRLANDPAHELVCMPQQPQVVIGGVGESSDPFRGLPYPCDPGGGDIFGCDIDEGMPTAAAPVARATTVPVDTDMETAAIAKEAADHGVPFIAFRAVSDGKNDPLNLGPFFAQFAAYYRFAASNAAIATVAFLRELSLPSEVSASQLTARSQIACRR